jgi:hypothetical protein
VLNYNEMENTSMREMHNVSYLGNLGYHKLITCVRSQYFWPERKKEVANYIAKCLEFQNMKTEHRHLARLLLPFPIT